MGWGLDASSLGQYIRIIVSKFLPIPLSSFGTVGVLVVICAHLLSLFYVLCFYSLEKLVSKTCLYNYHTDFPNIFCMWVFINYFVVL